MDASGRRLPVLLSGIRITQPDGSEHIWSVVQDLSERRQFEQQLQRAALTDELTGLPNRALLLQRLSQVLREVRAGGLPGAALLFVDFDRFKQINDSHGHDAGDELLRKAAMRMRAVLRAEDIGPEGSRGNLVARFGGDEFVVLLADVHDEAAACQVAQRLIETVAPPYRLGGAGIELGVSVGVVLLDPGADSADEILRRADQAMYRAKNAGGGRVEVCRR
jgi:diguanylate cyclase (GGDEF)-like protein